MSKTIYYDNLDRSIDDFFKLEVTKHMEESDGAVFNQENQCWIIKPLYE
jgi:hypothetical protein